MTDTADAIAAFLAKGGKVQRVASDERAMTEREMYLARRGELPREKSDNELIDERHVGAPDHMGRRAVTNGLGEFIGYC